MRAALAPVVLSALLAACGGEDPVASPITHSQQVAITIPVQSSDVSGGMLVKATSVSAEPGNPYGAFIQAATDDLGGHAPSRIVVTSAVLDLLAAGSTSGLQLQHVFTGALTVSFRTAGGVHAVGTLSNPSGVGPVAFAVSFDTSDLPPAEQQAIVQGLFSVELSGTPSGGFTSAHGELKVSLTFVAHE